jgi:hypothetical protein
MKETNQKFWAILAVCNVLAITYPLRLYVQADGGSQLMMAVLVGAAFLLAVADVITVVVRYVV